MLREVCNSVSEIGIPFKKCWIIKTILSRTRQEYIKQDVQKTAVLFLVGNYIVIFFQTLHEDVRNFVHLVLVLNCFQKFFPVYAYYL